MRGRAGRERGRAGRERGRADRDDRADNTGRATEKVQTEDNMSQVVEVERKSR